MQLKQVVVTIECAELCGSIGLTAERLTITNLLNVSKTASNAFIAVGVESVEIDRNSCVNTAVNLGSVKHGLNLGVYNLRSRGAVGVDEVCVCVSLIILTLDIAITKRCLKSRLVGLLAAELTDAFLDGCIDSCVNLCDSLGIALAQEYIPLSATSVRVKAVPEEYFIPSLYQVSS